MDTNGFIKLHRSLTRHWLWSDKPFSKGQAWVDILLLATWKDSKELYRGKLVQRSPGEVSASILWFADRWGWHRDTVRRFLATLEADGMATIETTTQGTTLTVANWAMYQNGAQQEQQREQQGNGNALGNGSNNGTTHYKKVEESKEGIKKGEEENALNELRKQRDQVIEKWKGAF